MGRADTVRASRVWLKPSYSTNPQGGEIRKTTRFGPSGNLPWNRCPAVKGKRSLALCVRVVLLLFMAFAVATSCAKNHNREREHVKRLELTREILAQPQDIPSWLERLKNPADMEYLKELWRHARELAANGAISSRPYLFQATCQQVREGDATRLIHLYWLKREKPPSSVSRIHFFAQGTKGKTSVVVPVPSLVTYHGQSTDSYIWTHYLTAEVVPGDDMEYRMEETFLSAGYKLMPDGTMRREKTQTYKAPVVYIGANIIEKGSIEVRISDEAGEMSNQVRLIRLRTLNRAIKE